MKKIFLFAATAALLTACSSEELTGVETAQQKAGEAPINFSVYTPRSITRAGVAGTTSNTNIGQRGIGILAYYTDDEVYNKETSKPNYMYNTKLSNDGSKWVYNPVMYWPNEYGTNAVSDYVDYVSFFAYAPYIDVENTTGIPELKQFTVDPDDWDAVAANLKYKYAVPTYADPYSIADLAGYTALRTAQGHTYIDATDWFGEVKAEAEAFFGATFGDEGELVTYINTTLASDDPHLINGATDKQVTTLETYKEFTGMNDDEAKAALEDIYKKLIQGKNITEISSNTSSGDPIVKYVVDTDPATSVDLLWGVAANTTDYTAIDAANTNVQNNAGLPFVNLIKPKDPVNGKMNLRMLHALSRLNVNIKYIADAETPDGASETINADETRIYVRSIKIGGFITKAALNLNNTEEKTITIGSDNIDFGIPNWKAYDGKTALTSTEAVKFLDGRKDGKEGMENGTDKNEQPTGLNPLILENYTKDLWGGMLWQLDKNPGVTKEAVNLFGNGYSDADEPIFVIPTGDPIDIEIVYDVMTKDNNLSTFLSDGLTHGSIITNTISKTSKEIFGSATNMEPGNAYTIKIILGMTSVKFDAAVEPWNEIAKKPVDLPDNQ